MEEIGGWYYECNRYTAVLTFFLVSWQFVGYPSLMAVVAIWARPKENDYSFQPFVSIVVPTQLLIKIKRVNK